MTPPLALSAVFSRYSLTPLKEQTKAKTHTHKLKPNLYTTPPPPNLFSPPFNFTLFPSSFEIGHSTVWLTVQNQIFGLLGEVECESLWFFSLQAEKRLAYFRKTELSKTKKAEPLPPLPTPQFLSKWLSFHPRLRKIAKQTSAWIDITVKLK